MKFTIKIQYFKILIFFQFLSFYQHIFPVLCQDCDGKSLEIFVESTSAGFNSKFGSHPNVVELVEDADVSRSYFECKSHNGPVDWIMDIHPVFILYSFNLELILSTRFVCLSVCICA
jgi:hypothetical protein